MASHYSEYLQFVYSPNLIRTLSDDCPFATFWYCEREGFGTIQLTGRFCGENKQAFHLASEMIVCRISIIQSFGVLVDNDSYSASTSPERSAFVFHRLSMAMCQVARFTQMSHRTEALDFTYSDQSDSRILRSDMNFPCAFDVHTLMGL